MYFDYTPEQTALREELRAYFDQLITDELLAELDQVEGGGPLYHDAMQQLGADGWLGIGWPEDLTTSRLDMTFGTWIRGLMMGMSRAAPFCR